MLVPCGPIGPPAPVNSGVRHQRANTVLLQTWSPITHDFGLIHASTDAVCSALTAWQESIGNQYAHRSLGDLEAALNSLPPLSAEKRRCLLVPTTSEWTAFFQSGLSGSDPFPAMSYLSKQLGVDAMRVCVAPPSSSYQSVIWEFYAPQHRGGDSLTGVRRAIAASNDGGRWKFSSSGLPFEFENVEKYSLQKNKTDSPRKFLVNIFHTLV
jgi:hypothetical protein